VRGRYVTFDVDTPSFAALDYTFGRTGTGLSMKIQAGDCASGGVLQMEPERADGTATRITHTLGPDVFHFDDPAFRAVEGQALPFKDDRHGRVTDRLRERPATTCRHQCKAQDQSRARPSCSASRSPSRPRAA
jgi:hypothetical protein